jgi:hypothetical protein
MTLYDEIIAELPELKDSVEFFKGSISLRNDGDGDYIERWEYAAPLPKKFKIGK